MNNLAHTSDTTRLYLKQAFLQGFAAFAGLCITTAYCEQFHRDFSWGETSLVIGLVAFVLTSLGRHDWWWKAIHLLFAPSAYLLFQREIAPNWYLGAAIVLFLVFRGAFSGRVPPYWSSNRAAQALAELLIHTPPAKLIDLGAGMGSLTAPLAHLLKGTLISGIENALIPWLTGYVRCKRISNCKWIFGDFWETHLADYDVVYAFLSPEPMGKLWRKATDEMRPGTLFVSNSFPVPDVGPAFIVDVDDPRQTRLYCYRIGQASIEADSSPRHHHHGLRSA